MQRIVVIPYRRFGTTYRSHLQGSIGFHSGSYDLNLSRWLTFCVEESVPTFFVHLPRSEELGGRNTSFLRHTISEVSQR